MTVCFYRSFRTDMQLKVPYDGGDEKAKIKQSRVKTAVNINWNIIKYK